MSTTTQARRRKQVKTATKPDVDGYADPRFSGAHCLNVTRYRPARKRFRRSMSAIAGQVTACRQGRWRPGWRARPDAVAGGRVAFRY